MCLPKKYVALCFVNEKFIEGARRITHVRMRVNQVTCVTEELRMERWKDGSSRGMEEKMG